MISIQKQINILRSSFAIMASIAMIGSFLYLGNFISNRTATANTSCGTVNDPLPSWLLNSVDVNKAAYLEVQNNTGVPWEMLAAIHYRETNFSRQNPSNGQGIFQFVNGDGGPYPTGPVSEREFRRQLNFMASRIQNDYVYRGTLKYTKRPLQPNEPEVFRVKDTLFSYNGRAGAYANQATLYGYNSATQPYEGSPYVMNKFDCKRSAMGIITRDFGRLDGIDTRMGAFTLYARLKSDTYWQSLVAERLPGCTPATRTNVACVWQLTNVSNGSVVFASNVTERARYVSLGYQYQNVAFYGTVPQAPHSGGKPVYLVEKPDGSSFLTMNKREYDALAAVWSGKSVAFYADPAWSNTGYPVHRLYNAATGVHRWVSSRAEVSNLIRQGFRSEGVAFVAVSAVRREVPPPQGSVLTYRFGNMPGNLHFWTTDVYERDQMIRTGVYRYEGVSWHASSTTTNTPIYRLYSPTMRKHLFTRDAHERSVLLRSSSWRDEGIAFHAGANASRPVYRLYSPRTYQHLYTTNAYERSVLIRNGTFRDEGVGWLQP